MSFSLVPVLEAEYNKGVYPFNTNSGEKTLPEFDVMKDVFKKYAEDLFFADFQSRLGIDYLLNFAQMKVTYEELATTDLSDRLQAVSSICHSKLLAASDRKGELNVSELKTIKDAFANLASVYEKIENPSDDEKAILKDMNLLNQSLPLFIKASKHFVEDVKSFDYQLLDVISSSQAGDSVSNAVISLKELLFSKNSEFSRRAIIPDFGKLAFKDCFPAASNYILSLAKVAHDAKRDLTSDELETLANTMKNLRQKLKVLRYTNLKEFVADKLKNQFNTKMDQSDKLIRDLNGRILAQQEVIKGLESNFSDFKTNINEFLTSDDFKESLVQAVKAREANIEKAKKELTQLICQRDGVETSKGVSTHQNTIIAKKLDEKTVNNLFEKIYVESDVLAQSETLNSLQTLSENPALLGQCAIAYINHLQNEESRLPKGFFANIFG
ncbi:MAG: hypothetical protein VX777_06120 [Chlamydiota bacterium]|nr:hypothetical protein [Chlamydiota bacterium]